MAWVFAPDADCPLRPGGWKGPFMFDFDTLSNLIRLDLTTGDMFWLPRDRSVFFSCPWAHVETPVR